MPENFRKTDLLLLPLRKLVESGDYPKGARLPSMQSLAREFSVSVGTVRRAVEILEVEGWVETRPGSGLYMKRGKPADLPCPIKAGADRIEKSDEIAEAISEEISSGNWKVGNQVPSLKETRYHFKTSPHTLNKALKKLAQRKLVHRSGNSWIVGQINAPGQSHEKRVYAVTGGAPTLSGRGARTIPSDFLLSFERELANCGVCFMGNLGPNDPNRPTAQSLARKGAFGFLLHGFSEGWAAAPEPFRIQVERDLSWASDQKIPTVVYNCAPILGAFPNFSFKPYKGVYPLGLDNHTIGREVGEFLGAMGHKRVAYFSYSDNFWVSQRQQGILRTKESLIDPLEEIVPFQAGKTKLGILNPRGVDQEKLRKLLLQIAAEISPGFKEVEKPAIPRISDPVYKMVIQDRKWRQMQPYFEKARKDRSITAWATSDPEVAEGAARFLRENNIAVPKEISLISMDDNETLSFIGVTACNTQVDRLGYLAAHCLTGDIPLKRNRNGMIICPPRIIDRGSVAKV